MVTSDFRPEAEVTQFRSCALWPNRRNFRALQELWVEEHAVPLSRELGPRLVQCEYINDRKFFLACLLEQG